MLLSARWETPSPDTKVVVELPNGSLIGEADFAANNIAVVDELSTDTSRTVILVAPSEGVYDLMVEDETGLGTVEYFALGETEAPILTLTGVDALPDGMVEISFEAFDVDSDAEIQFWYDDDLTELDGFFIGSALEADGPGTFLWDAVTAVPGDYFVYAVIDDGESIPVIDTFDTAVTAGSQTDIGIELQLIDAATGGSTVTLDVRVENLGPAVARNTVALVSLPTGLALADALPTNVVEQDGTLSISFGDIPPGDIATQSFDLVTAEVTGNTPLFIDAYVMSDIYDGVTANDTAVAAIALEPPPAAVIDLSVGQNLLTVGPVTIGETLFYEISVANAGPDVARNVVLTETIDGLTDVVFSEAATPTAPGTHVLDLGDIDVGDTRTVTVSGTTTKVGSIQSTSSVVGDGTETELTLFDNESTALFTVGGLPPEPADLSLGITAGAPDVDGLRTVSVTVTNDGPGVGSNVAIALSIPQNLALIGFSTLQGTFDPDTGVWSLGNIRDNLSRTLLLEVDGAAATGIVDITAEIIAMDENDPDSTPDNGDPAEDDFAAISLQYSPEVVIGTDEGDQFDGDQIRSNAAQIYKGRAGDDSINGGGGNDFLLGGAGNDTIDGGQGNDTILGLTGDDLLTGGDGADQFRFAAADGNDTITDFSRGEDVLNLRPTREVFFLEDIDQTTSGDDLVVSFRGTSVLLEGLGGETLDAIDFLGVIPGGGPTEGDDRFATGSAADEVFDGLGGNDVIATGKGNDRISGGDGDDFLHGAADNDTLDGGTGNDTLVGASGDDVMTGGDGADVFRFGANEGNDIITDFETGIDVINLKPMKLGDFSEVIIADGGSDTTVTVRGTTIVMESVAGISESDFII